MSTWADWISNSLLNKAVNGHIYNNVLTDALLQDIMELSGLLLKDLLLYTMKSEIQLNSSSKAKIKFHQYLLEEKNIKLPTMKKQPLSISKSRKEEPPSLKLDRLMLLVFITLQKNTDTTEKSCHNVQVCATWLLKNLLKY